MKPFYPLMLLAICLSITINTTAQKQRPATLHYNEARWVAKLSATSWLDPETPTLQPGIEYRINKRWSAEFAVGLPLKMYDELKSTDSTYNRFFKLKAEMKYFPGEKRTFYIGPEVAFVRRHKTQFNDWFINKSGNEENYDFAELSKSVFTLAFKVGWSLPAKAHRNWMFDVFFGAGPRFAHGKIDAVNRQPTSHGWYMWNSDREGFTTSIHVTTGLKLGYIID